MGVTSGSRKMEQLGGHGGEETGVTMHVSTTHVWTFTRVSTCTWKSASMLDTFLNQSPLTLKLTDLARLAGQPAPGLLL